MGWYPIVQSMLIQVMRCKGQCHIAVPFAKWPDPLAKSDFGGTSKSKFQFLSSRFDEKLTFDQNIEKHSTGSDSQGGWQDVSGRVASWTAFSFRPSKIKVWTTFCSRIVIWTNPG